MAFDPLCRDWYPAMRSLVKPIASLSALLFLTACTTVQTQSEFRSRISLSSLDNVVLLSNLASDHAFSDKDVDSCVRPAMLDAAPELRFMPAKQFRENLFPYFMPSTTPHEPGDYKRILDKEEVQERVASLGVRYLIILTKGGTGDEWHGGILCGAGYGGGGCFGLSWWNRKSELGLAIWDLRDISHAGSIQADATGTGIMPALLLPIPLYMPATQSAVCRELGTRLGKFLSGRE